MHKIAITMGDPAGIGAEVIIKALADKKRPPDFIPVIIGDKNVLELNLDKTGCDIEFIDVTKEKLEGLRPLNSGECYILEAPVKVDMTDFKFGAIKAEYGRAAGNCIETAATLVIERKLDALVTAPINKKAFNLGGYDFQGHTDFLSHLAGGKKEVMMLTGGKLSVILCTVHISLKEAIETLNEDLIVETVTVAKKDFKRYFNIPSPRFAVCGLNPHASEDGTFGNEENDIIIPAVNRLKETGIDVTGPAPPDSLFYHAKEGAYDAVICMYHDQGLIPIKTLFFDTGINITLGIDMIRTSVDHGTAFEIAGKGKASELSMLSAIEKSLFMCDNEKKNR